MSCDNNKNFDNWEEVKATAEGCLDKEIVDLIDESNGKEYSKSFLIAVLHKVQSKYGYVSPEHIDAVAQLMQISAAKVSGVATFYHFFRTVPRGKFMINICLGTACYVKGAEAIVEAVTASLGIGLGETTSDGMFSLESARCVGTCGLAPVVIINDKVHGKVTPEQIPVILEECRKGKAA